MRKPLVFAIGTLLGGAIGAGSTYFVINKRYEERANKEMDEIRSHYISEIDALKSEIATLKQEAAEELEKLQEEKPAKAKKAKSKVEEEADDDDSEYKRVLAKQNYSDISEEKKPKKEKKSPNRPYCITPEQYQIESQYAKVTLDYWNGNGYFTNIEGDEEPEAGVWIDVANTLSRVGDYEEDTLYVRNDRLQTDYEIYFHEDEWGGLEEE